MKLKIKEFTHSNHFEWIGLKLLIKRAELCIRLLGPFVCLRFFKPNLLIYNNWRDLRLLLCTGKKKLLFWVKKSKFVLLKKFLPILTILLLAIISSPAQQERSILPDATQRVLKLYPNPATSFIKIEFQKNYNSGFNLQIINFLGKQVYEVKNLNSTISMDLATFPRGVYIYQLKDREGKMVESGKFQVAK